MHMIRPATPGDAAAAVPLLFHAMEEIALKLTGLDDPREAVLIFETLFRRPATSTATKIHCCMKMKAG